MAEAKPLKVSRKALREPDEFQVLTTQAFDWIRENQSALIGIVSALIAVGAILIGVNWYGQRQADAAAARFTKAQSMFDEKKYADAAAEFDAVATAYPRTASGRLARLYRAHALAHQPDPAGASTAYADYLESNPPTDYLRQEALVGLGHTAEAKSDTNAAMDAYRQAIDAGGPFTTQARLALARLEEAAGNAEKARQLYADVLQSPDLDPETRQELSAKVPSPPPPPAQ
jgi:predicted negative regulator of RcsB-dependent stress response